ncbi:MAG: nucleotide exchange factor GrpE [Bacilli bacterium]|mgnify:CR=1 FL=1|nr:nucleotide exchange factor GrpE [Bacilli bacterium]MDD4608313.1 nucleotide exchange factor GrpE [Bacilli bacterium]
MNKAEKEKQNKQEECKCEHTECQCEEVKDECKCEQPEKQKKATKKDKHMDKLNEAYNKISELEDTILRNKAEFVNYRKRLEEEQSRILKYSNEDIIKELLPILDNFERAISMDDDNLEDEVSKFLAGFKLIYGNLVNILNDFEVTEVKGLDEEFDPTYQQAVMTEEKEGVEPGTVIEVLQKGYMLKEKVIRPAMVKVSK